MTLVQKGDGALVEALEFYADPFAWKKKHDPQDLIGIPDFYSELSFGGAAAEVIATARALGNVANAASAYMDYLERSVNVGPLTKGPSREAELIRDLRAALAASQTGGGQP